MSQALLMQATTGASMMSASMLQEPDKAREIFFLYDREASGKLSDANFYQALLAGGAKLSDADFKGVVLAEFGSHPNLVVFKQALHKAKSRDETFESLKAKFASFGETVTVEALRYFVTFSAKERLDEEECEDFIKLADPEGTGVVNVETLCHKLIPH